MRFPYSVMLALAVGLIAAPPATAAETSKASTGRACGVVYFSIDFVNSLLMRDVKSTTTVAEEMLGAMTYGTAKTRGKLMVDFVPSLHSATIDLRMVGGVDIPDSVAQQGGVSVYTKSHTSIDGRKRVVIDGSGIRSLPASAQCETKSEVLNIKARGPLVERLAARRVDRKKGEAESLAARRIERQVAEQLDRETRQPLSEADKKFKANIGPRLHGEKALSEKISFRTGERVMVVQAVAPHGKSSGHAPYPVSRYHDLAFYLHESLVVSVTEKILGGNTVSDKTWLQIMETLTGSEPRALWVHDRRPRWSVTLAKKAPLRLELGDGVCEVFLTFQAVTRGGTEIKHPIEVAGRFKLQPTNEGPCLIRQGELTARYLESSAEPRKRDDVSFLKRKFNAVLQDEIHFDGLVPPAGGSWGKLRRLQLVELSADEGWLALGYRLIPDLAKKPKR